jgi:hypothetical protein
MLSRQVGGALWRRLLSNRGEFKMQCLRQPIDSIRMTPTMRMSMPMQMPGPGAGAFVTWEEIGSAAGM